MASWPRRWATGLRSSIATTPSATPKAGNRWPPSSRSAPWRMKSLPTRWPIWCCMARVHLLRSRSLAKARALTPSPAKAARPTPPWLATAPAWMAPTTSASSTAPMKQARLGPLPYGRARGPRCCWPTPSSTPSSFPGSNTATRNSNSSGWTASWMNRCRRKKARSATQAARTIPKSCAIYSKQLWPTTR